MKEESFLKSFMTIGFATVINLIVGFITIPIITRLVDPYEYGQFSIFTMYTNLALMVLCFGMDQSFVRFYYSSGELVFKRKLIAEVMVLPIVGTVIFLIGSLLLIGNRIIPFEFNMLITAILAGNIFFSVVYRFSELALRLSQKNRFYGIIHVLHKLVYFLLAIVLLGFSAFDGTFILSLSTIMATFICVVFSLYPLKELLPTGNDCKMINKGELIQMVKYGFPFILSIGITSIFQNLDKLALNHYRTYSEVGIYASAMTLVALFSVVQSSFSVIWAPRSIEHYEKNPNDKSYYINAFNTMNLVMFSFGIALIMFKDLFSLLLGEKYVEAAYIMPFLVFYPIMCTVSEITVCGIDFTKKSTLHILIASGACITNYIGNTLLVPTLGCKGAAISTGLSYIVFFILRTLISEHFYYVGYNKIRFCFITGVTVCYAFFNTFYKFGLWSIVFGIVCFIILFLCYMSTVQWIARYVISRLHQRSQSK